MRVAMVAACLLSTSCPYGYDLVFDDEEVISCSGNQDCEANEMCRGIISESEVCTADGYVRIEDGKVSLESTSDPSIAFICYQDKRYFPFCVDDQLTVCESDSCNSTHVCASPIGGGNAECVIPEDPAVSCTTDSDCTPASCFAHFAIGDDSWQVDMKCATATAW